MSKTAIAIGIIVVAACVPVGDSEFHARVAAGCSSVEECDGLYEQAHARLVACSKRSVGPADCNSEMQDQLTVGILRTEQVGAAKQTRTDHVEARQAAVEQSMRETQERAANVAKDTDERLAARCAADRDERIAIIRAALKAASDAQRETDRREAYVKAHCRPYQEPIYDKEVRADPGTGVLRLVTVQVDTLDAWKCPPGSPKGLLDDDGQIQSTRQPDEPRAAARKAIDRSRICNDLDANNPDALEFAGAMANDGGLPDH